MALLNMKTIVVIPTVATGEFDVEIRVPRTRGEEVVMQQVVVRMPALPSETEDVSPILVPRGVESTNSEARN